MRDNDRGPRTLAAVLPGEQTHASTESRIAIRPVDGAGRPGVAAAVDLVTLPTREGTQLTIYNSEDITMVREHRLLTVKEGVNRIQFSWANTLIDPTSIEFRILDNQDKVDLVDTTFPAGRNDALQWNIQSKMAGKIPVEIRYFTSGITWAADYVGIANEDETKLQPDRLRAGDQQLGRAVRQRPDAAGGGHDQPGGEDRGPGEEAAAGRWQTPTGRPETLPELLADSWPKAETTTGRDGKRCEMPDGKAGKPKPQAGHQAGPLRILPLHHRRPRGHQGQGAQAAGGPEGGRGAAGVPLQAHRPRRRHSSSPSSTASRTSSCWTSRARRRSSRDGEPGPLAAAQRHGPAVLRVPEQGPGLRGRHARPSTCPSATGWR